MEKPQFDPGLTQQYTDRLRRSINPDGSFNVKLRGSRFKDRSLYLRLINMDWPWFIVSVFTGYLAVNLLFAFLYLMVGVEHLHGAETSMPGSPFWGAFFFSAHTLTTVGYGSISPEGPIANTVASIEAMAGVLGFAIATGLLYGRFSRPQARILFSEKILIAPYQTGSAVMFRIANRRENVLMEVEAALLFMTVDGHPPHVKRNFVDLPLERPKVFFLPLTWTIVHPIDESSPLYGKSEQDLIDEQVEFIVLIRCFDDTFSQTVDARYSYPSDQIVWARKFGPAFHVDSEGEFVLEIDKLNDTLPAPFQQTVRF